jgi:GNAT superfamily N-acetyltransferase
MRLDKTHPNTEVRALFRAHARIADVVPGGSAERDEAGIDRVAIPVPVPTMSGLFLSNESVDPDALRSAADWFIERRHPWSINVAGAVSHAVEVLAEAVEFESHVEPTLIATLHNRSRDGNSGGLQNSGTGSQEREQYRRVVTEEERRSWIETCDTAFGLPDGTSNSMLTSELLAEDDLRAYLVLDAGEPVGTACTVLDDAGTIGLFCIATRREARGRGIGRRLVEFLLDDGAARGASSAYLQSSELARPLYERIGFVDGDQDVTVFAPKRRPASD